MPLDIIGRISDTTGTLLAGNYADHNCRIGLILGTGILCVLTCHNIADFCVK